MPNIRAQDKRYPVGCVTFSFFANRYGARCMDVGRQDTVPLNALARESGQDYRCVRMLDN